MCVFISSRECYWRHKIDVGRKGLKTYADEPNGFLVFVAFDEKSHIIARLQQDRVNNKHMEMSNIIRVDVYEIA